MYKGYCCRIVKTFKPLYNCCQLHPFPWPAIGSASTAFPEPFCAAESPRQKLLWFDSALLCYLHTWYQLASSNEHLQCLSTATDAMQCQAALHQCGIRSFDEFLRFCLQKHAHPRFFLDQKKGVTSYQRSSLHYDCQGIKALLSPLKFPVSRLNHPAWKAWTAVLSSSQEACPV